MYSFMTRYLTSESSSSTPICNHVLPVLVRLQKKLMLLQQKQLDELAEWMANMEDQIQNQEAIGSDLEAIQAQVNKHKVGRPSDPT